MYKIKTQDTLVELPAKPYLSAEVVKDFDSFGKEVFGSDLACFEVINKAYEQQFTERKEAVRNRVFAKNDTDVLLLSSGGLDSSYFACNLAYRGYRPTLLFVHSANKYEGRNSFYAVSAFAEKSGFPLVEAKLSSKGFWPENPIKNQMMLAIAADIAFASNFSLLALGDDKHRTLSTFTKGVNTTDCKEVSDAFENWLMEKCEGLSFVKFPTGSAGKPVPKADRLLYLKEHGFEDTIYSCVLAGRFHRYRHDEAEKKYGISLPYYNCGCSCRKCAHHNLIRAYVQGVQYPKEFLQKCWQRLYDSPYATDKSVFSPDIPLAQRIAALSS